MYRILAPDPGRRLCWVADSYANLCHHARSRRRRRVPGVRRGAGRVRARGPRVDRGGGRRQRRFGRAGLGCRREGDRARGNRRPGPRPEHRRGGSLGRRPAVCRRRRRRAALAHRARRGVLAERSRPRRRDWLVRRCAGRSEVPFTGTRNLLHHYVHQTGHEDASTFWCGCGAIRRAVFLEDGRLQRRLRRPVDRGHRVRLSAAACRPPNPPGQRRAGDAPEALDGAVAASHRHLRARGAVDAADHPLAHAAERPQRQVECARQRGAGLHPGCVAGRGPVGGVGRRRPPSSRASASWR